MNWVDGKTDAAEIARRVCAEGALGGLLCYGKASLELVEKFFEQETKDGLIVW
jgi:hypothetical protein